MVQFSEVDELKYEYEKALRVKVNLEKNLERRKKLNLLDDSSESELRDDIAQATRTVDDMRRRLRAMESQRARSQTISDTSERSPWEK